MLRIVIGTMTDHISLVLEMMHRVTMYSHRMLGKRPAERPVAAGQDRRDSKATETEVEMRTAGMDTTIDNDMRKTGHRKRSSSGGHPEEGKKFAEVVNSVHMLPIILSLKFLTHRIHPNTLVE